MRDSSGDDSSSIDCASSRSNSSELIDEEVYVELTAAADNDDDSSPSRLLSSQVINKAEVKKNVDGSDSDSDSDSSVTGLLSLSCQSIEEKYVVISDDVVIHSIDADGCFLPHFSKSRPQYYTMAQHNRQFFSAFLQSAKEVHERTIILSGSARQGYLRDLAAMFQKNERSCSITDSYFFALQKFVDDINASLPNENRVVLDHFLLDDVYFDRPSGDTFREALKYGLEWSNIIHSTLDSEKKLKPLFDEAIVEKKIDELRQRMAARVMEGIKEQKKAHQKLGFFWETFNRFPLCEHPGKFALLYGQIHHIASQFPSDTPLHFHFYDDRLDILGPLVAVFTELLPQNMTLYFHHYINGQQQLNPNDNAPVLMKLKGTGIVDSRFRETLRDMTSKLPVSTMYEGGIELPYRFGNPLDCLFKTDSDAKFNSDQLIAPVVTLSSRDAFEEFNNDRLIRMGVREEPSFAGFFAEMRRMHAAFENNMCQIEKLRIYK